MKRLLSRAFATVALTLCALPIAAQTTPSYNEETVISFLGNPTKDIGGLNTTITSEYLMSLLDENAKKYVESIEWNSIYTRDYVKDKPSTIGLQIESNSAKTGYITIHFKENYSFNAGRVILYGGVGDADNYSDLSTAHRYMKVTVNNDLSIGMGPSAVNPYFTSKFQSSKYDLSGLIEQMATLHSSSEYKSGPNYKILRTKDTENLFSLKSLKIELLPLNFTLNSERTIALHGIKIQHNGFVENDINTVVEEVADVNGVVEYFDLYGRRLAEKPIQGLYIEKRGSKVSKLLAR